MSDNEKNFALKTSGSREYHLQGKNVADHFFLNVGLLLCVFYPFKGLLSLVLYVLSGEDGFANYINPGMAFTLMLFVILSFISYARWSYFSKLDLYLGSVGTVLLIYSFVRQNFAYSQVIMFLLIMPLVLAHMTCGSDMLFRRAVRAFFLITVLYIATEHILLHSHIYGVTDQIVFTSQDLARYYSLLASGQNLETVEMAGIVIDFRNTTLYDAAGRIRTSGFLANPLQMPTLISMSATFFYISYRRDPSVFRVVALLLSLFALGNSLSTTGVVAFALAVVIYEFVYNRGPKKYLILSVLVGCFVTLVIYAAPVFYLFARLIGSWDEYIYKFGLVLPSWQDYGMMLIGKFGWLPGWNNLYSESDIVNVMTSFGIIIAFLIFKRLIGPAFVARRFDNDELVIYAMVVLNAVFNLMHREAVLSPNVYLMVALLNVKTYRIIREHSAARI